MHSEPGLERSRGSRLDEAHAVFAAFAGAHEQAAVGRPPVFDQQAQDFAGTQCGIGQHEDQRPIPRAFEGSGTCCEYRAQLVVGRDGRQRLRRAHGEAA